jgi:hypothetical protein
VVRDDGKIVGVVFVGASGDDAGHVVVAPPDPIEQWQMERWTGMNPYDKGVSAAWMMATDATVDDLLGDDEWITSGEGGAGERAAEIHRKRWEMTTDPLWNDWGPSLAMDVLHDLYGDGYQGGYLFADLKVDASTWVTYHTNPRGALYPTEDVAFFLHERQGDDQHRHRGRCRENALDRAPCAVIVRPPRGGVA